MRERERLGMKKKSILQERGIGSDEGHKNSYGRIRNEGEEEELLMHTHTHTCMRESKKESKKERGSEGDERGVKKERKTLLSSLCAQAHAREQARESSEVYAGQKRIFSHEREKREGSERDYSLSSLFFFFFFFFKERNVAANRRLPDHLSF